MYTKKSHTEKSCHLMLSIKSLIGLLIYLLCNCTLTGAATSNSAAKEYWRAFRHLNPLFIQDVVASSPSENGSRLLLLSEPPPLLYESVEETLRATFGDTYNGHEIFTQKVGFDGWVKDIVVCLAYSRDTNRSFEHDIANLHQRIFGTDYKAGYRLFDIKPWTYAVTLKRKTGAPPDLRVSANSINDWFFENPVRLLKRTAGTVGIRSRSDTPLTLEEVFDSMGIGVFYSTEPGLVVLLVNKGYRLNDAKALLRQFFLDTDAILGAIEPSNTESDTFAIIGRERDTTISAMPPLRVETVLTLAATDEQDLEQSYERNSPLADKTTDDELVEFVGIKESELTDPRSILEKLILGEKGVDWAPILLSQDLMHTEYGNLLNVTDQILKCWSKSGNVRYGNFPYLAPLEYPYAYGLREHLNRQLNNSPTTITYNWNTAGFGSWVSFADFKIFALHHTGALPVSYIVDSIDFATDPDSEAAFIEAENTYWQFFAGLQDPSLNRAAQYAALHMIFRKHGLMAERQEPKPSNQEYSQRWKALKEETLAALNAAMEHSDKSQQELKKLLEDCQCMSTFKYQPLEEWSQKRESILSRIGKYRDSANLSMDELSWFLADRSTLFYKPLNSKVSSFNSLLSPYKAKVERYNRDVRSYNSSQKYLIKDPSVSLLLAERNKQIEAEAAKLNRLSDEIDKLNQKINFINDISTDLNIAIEVFGNCNRAWRGLVAEQKDFSYGFIKTPSIVVSQESRYIYGGHNLYGRSIEIVPDSSVRRGSFRYDPVMDVLLINPDDRANTGAVARTFERFRNKYLVGSTNYKQRIARRIRSVLAKPVGPAEPVKTALLRKVPFAAKTRGFGSTGRDLDRVVVGGRPVELNVADTQKFTRIAETSKAQVIVQKTVSGHRVVYVGQGKLFARETATPADFQRAVERIVDYASRDLRGKVGNVVIITDGTMSWGDMQALHLTANARQNAVLKAGAGGMFSGKKSSPLRILAGLSPEGKPVLTSNRANWSDAVVKSRRFVSSGNKGTAILMIEVPFNEIPAINLRMRISAFFGRKPSQNDINTLSRVIFDNFDKDLPDSTVRDRIDLIRQEYKKRLDEDVNLRFMLQKGNQDMIIIKAFQELVKYEQV